MESALRDGFMAEKVVIFGAGATGRGHIGLLAWQAGCDIVFVDKNPALVDALLQRGSYIVTLYGRWRQEILVSGYRVYHAGERAAIAEEIRNSGLVLTAVFDQNLPDVAQTIALGIAECARQGRTTPLNCIACENMMDSSTVLGKYVRQLLTGGALTWCEEYVGFPDCMISRVVPRPEPDPLKIIAEDYNEWTVRAEAFRGRKPEALTAMELVDNQTARLERKLFIHNGAHAVCGYLGFHRGHRYVHEALADPIVAQHVRGALDEFGEVVRCRWDFSRESIERYKQDFCRRAASPVIHDSILRVVRDPIRKLSTRERLTAPALLAVEYSLPRQWIMQGIVAALRYFHPDDLQAVELSEQLEKYGLQKVLENICGIPSNSPLKIEIMKAWEEWNL